MLDKDSIESSFIDLDNLPDIEILHQFKNKLNELADNQKKIESILSQIELGNLSSYDYIQLVLHTQNLIKISQSINILIPSFVKNSLNDSPINWPSRLNPQVPLLGLIRAQKKIAYPHDVVSINLPAKKNSPKFMPIPKLHPKSKQYIKKIDLKEPYQTLQTNNPRLYLDFLQLLFNQHRIVFITSQLVAQRWGLKIKQKNYITLKQKNSTFTDSILNNFIFLLIIWLICFFYLKRFLSVKRKLLLLTKLQKKLHFKRKNLFRSNKKNKYINNH